MYVLSNPKEYDNTKLMSLFLLSWGTKSILVSIDKSSRLIVGGTMLFFILNILNITSTAPVALRRCPIEDFIDDRKCSTLPIKLSLMPYCRYYLIRLC